MSKTSWLQTEIRLPKKIKVSILVGCLILIILWLTRNTYQKTLVIVNLHDRGYGIEISGQSKRLHADSESIVRLPQYLYFGGPITVTLTEQSGQRHEIVYDEETVRANSVDSEVIFIVIEVK